jgi:hypothetical protein
VSPLRYLTILNSTCHIAASSYFAVTGHWLTNPSDSFMTTMLTTRVPGPPSQLFPLLPFTSPLPQTLSSQHPWPQPLPSLPLGSLFPPPPLPHLHHLCLASSGAGKGDGPTPPLSHRRAHVMAPDSWVRRRAARREVACHSGIWSKHSSKELCSNGKRTWLRSRVCCSHQAAEQPEIPPASNILPLA